MLGLGCSMITIPTLGTSDCLSVYSKSWQKLWTFCPLAWVKWLEVSLPSLSHLENKKQWQPGTLSKAITTFLCCILDGIFVVTGSSDFFPNTLRGLTLCQCLGIISYPMNHLKRLHSLPPDFHQGGMVKQVWLCCFTYGERIAENVHSFLHARKRA